MLLPAVSIGQLQHCSQNYCALGNLPFRPWLCPLQERWKLGQSSSVHSRHRKRQACRCMHMCRHAAPLCTPHCDGTVLSSTRSLQPSTQILRSLRSIRMLPMLRHIIRDHGSLRLPSVQWPAQTPFSIGAQRTGQWHLHHSLLASTMAPSGGEWGRSRPR